MKLLRRILIALGLSLLAGFALGTVLRLRLERPVTYIGQGADSTVGRRAASRR